MDNIRRLQKLDELISAALGDRMPMGMYQSIPSPPVVEVCAKLGVEWFIFNMEHGGIESWPELRSLAMAADSVDIPFFVKLSEWSPSNAHHAIDMGAIGIVVPMVPNANALREMNQTLRFPPEGRRGYCPLSRAAHWGPEWVTNDFKAAEVEAYWELGKRAIVIPMIETQNAVDHIDEFLDVEECPILFPGSADLGMAYSKDGRFNFEERLRAEMILSDKIKAREDKILLHTYHPERGHAACMERLVDWGVRMPAILDMWALGGPVYAGSQFIQDARVKRAELKKK